MHDKDGAIECLEIAHEAYVSGDTAKATRLVHKCQRMFPTLNPREVRSCLQFHNATTLDKLLQYLSRPSASSSTSSSSSSGSSSSRPKSPRKREETKQSEPVEGVDYTTEDANEVKRILSVQSDYYQVLGVTKGSDAATIKKGYRKVCGIILCK
jgi:hypothetical protein